MNKDLDERIVPNGEYRDAMNIQISTSDADATTGVGNVGVVQNIQGNSEVTETSTTTWNNNNSKIIASAADEGNNKTYYFTAAPVPIDGILNGVDPSTITEEVIWIDSIVEVGVEGQSEDLSRKFIFIDKFAITNTASGVFGQNVIPDGSSYISTLTVDNASKYRVGMEIYVQKPDGGTALSGIRITKIDTTLNILYLSNTTNFNFTLANIVFKFIYPQRVLEFDYYNGDAFSSLNLIPSASINILDNLLMWSDGKHEPKKINIDRCEAGTNIGGTANDGQTHTKLFVKDPVTKELIDVEDIELLDTDTNYTYQSSDIKLENITTIKKAPLLPPNIEMSIIERDEAILEFPLTHQFVIDNNVPEAGDIQVIGFASFVNYQEDDIFTFTAQNIEPPVVIRGKVIESDGNNADVEILFVDSDLSDSNNPTNWIVTLEVKKPLFETKFGRLGYRYKYEDNECSSFSPWSELAFLPGSFEYTPQKGFNEGMANTARKIIIKDFIPTVYSRPLDVKAIDILWKTTDNANVYIVKTLTRGIDTEWKNVNVNGVSERGSLTITSEMIYKVLEETQLLRSWDNVPRYAKAQGISSNRILYGNYVQGYDMKTKVSLIQSIISQPVSFSTPKKSVKSLRSYQLGVVIGDEFGRETPVISSGYEINKDDGTFEVVPNTTKVEKSLSKFSNKIKVKPKWENYDPVSSDWMKYLKYYVKETSNEYYNLVLNRWYDASDDNVWLAFNSADRNKVQEGDYLILKNEHGSQNAVEEKARYKILSIENEAPDFIKTSNNDFPKEKMAPKHVFGEDGSGTVLQPTNAHPNNIISDGLVDSQSGIDRILLESAEPNDNGETPYLDDLTFRGTPMLRIVGTFTDTDGTKYEAFSPFRKVTRIIQGGNNGGEYGFGIRDPFTLSDVFMYQKIQLQLPDASTIGTPGDSVQAFIDSTAQQVEYHVQLRDAIVENKPEFDGKFFVKIAKDAVLKNKVLSDSLGEYQVLGSFQVAFISSLVTNPAYATNDYASDMLYETETWSGYGDNDVFTNTLLSADFENQPANSFGSDTDLTDDFWVGWSNDPNRTADIFIDGATAFSGFGLSSNDGNVGDDAMPFFNFGTSMQVIDGDTSNYHHFGLSNGTFNNGTEGQMIFSVIGPNGFTGSSSYFKTKMQTPGTLFRFADDPNQVVYRTFFINQQTGDGSLGFGFVNGPVTIESKNFNNNTSDFADRTSIIVRFHRDDDGSVGLDKTVWDPRGVIKHNGRGSMAIEIVERVAVQSLSEDSIATSAACFETEPKEDLGLDIYYEASRALPINLDETNIIDYTGAHTVEENAAKFSVGARNNQPVILTGNPYVHSTINENTITVKRNGNVNLTTDLTQGNSLSDGVCAAINDFVSFTHKDDLVTKAQISDHAKIVNSTAAPLAIPSDRYTISGNAVNFDPAQIFIETSVADASNITAGMQVTGANVNNGTFVISVATSGSNYIITLNQQLEEGGISSFTFIDVTGTFILRKDVYLLPVELGWFNCYSFGNGVESDRIRDDFNAPQIDNGIKVSSTFLEYGQEEKTSSIIYSGLYNSTSSTNELNQFNMANKITKDLNTTYGSIQAMKARDNDVVVFTEDKVLKVLSSGKDALFNADGNAQLTATSKVLGTAMPFSGDYGISKNPESLATDAYRMYFTDKQRGAVLRLSRDGLTPISDVGMKGYFREKLKYHTNILGSFDGVNDEYNLTLLRWNKFGGSNTVSPSGDQTISFNEKSKGWISFKSFIPTSSTNVTDRYYTTNENKIYKHYAATDLVSNIPVSNYNTFYGTYTSSTIDVLFNESASSIKSFKTVNYEGTQGKINQFTTESVEDSTGTIVDSINTSGDGEFYNLAQTKKGWSVESIETDLQKGSVPEFVEKEGKWFNYIKGNDEGFISQNLTNFNTQGLGFILAAPIATGFTPQQETTAQATDADGNDYPQTPE